MSKTIAGADKQETADETLDTKRARRQSRRISGYRTGPLAGLVSMRMVVLFNLMRRSTMVSHRRDFDLNENQWRIMSQMGEFAPLSLNGLAELLVQDPGQLSRAVKGMVERGWLTRERKPGGPEVEIGLTDAGQELWESMTQRAIDRDNFLTEGLSAQEVEAVRKVIDHMIDKAEDLMENALEEALEEEAR